MSRYIRTSQGLKTKKYLIVQSSKEEVLRVSEHFKTFPNEVINKLSELVEAQEI